MTKFESNITVAPYPVEQVYATLSDLNNLQKLAGKIPEDKIQELQYDNDSCSFSVSPVGNLAFRIIERELNKTIKFASEKSPVGCFLWIQVLPVNDNQTKMKLTVKAELNPFIKGMVSKPIQDGLNKIAELLASITY